MTKILTTSSAKQTQEIAKKLFTNLKTNIIALKGELGTGKTTFSQGIGLALGLKRVTSPTYILLRQYSLTHPRFDYFYHADLYRLTNPSQVSELGLKEIWSDKRNLLLIEWPEIIQELLPDNAITVSFTKLPNDLHELKIQ